jgi:hypothetical protein
MLSPPLLLPALPKIVYIGLARFESHTHIVFHGSCIAIFPFLITLTRKSPLCLLVFCPDLPCAYHASADAYVSQLEALCKQDARQLGYTLSDASRVFSKAKGPLQLQQAYVILTCTDRNTGMFEKLLSYGMVKLEGGALIPTKPWSMNESWSEDDSYLLLSRLFGGLEVSHQSLSAAITETPSLPAGTAIEADLTLFLPVEEGMDLCLTGEEFPFNNLQAGLENYICKNAPKAATANWHACAFQDAVTAALCCWFYSKMSIEEVKIVRLQLSLGQMMEKIEGLRLLPIRQPAAFHVLGLQAANRVHLLNSLWQISVKRAVTAKICTVASQLGDGRAPKRGNLDDVIYEVKSQEKRARAKLLKGRIEDQQQLLADLQAELGDLEMEL